MSFREKSAWIFLVSILLVAGFFFMHVPWTLTPPGLLVCVVVLVVIEAVAHLVVAAISPEDVKAPKDERERLIDLKAVRLAHYVYVVGSLLAVSTIHLGANAPTIGYWVLLALVVAEVVKNVQRIVGHRRGV